MTGTPSLQGMGCHSVASCWCSLRMRICIQGRGYVLLVMLTTASSKLSWVARTAVVEIWVEAHAPAARCAEQHLGRLVWVLRPEVAVEDERAVRICGQPAH